MFGEGKGDSSVQEGLRFGELVSRERQALLVDLGSGGLRPLDGLHRDLDALLVLHGVGRGALVVGKLDIAATAVEDLDNGGLDDAHLSDSEGAGVGLGGGALHVAVVGGVGGEGEGDSGGASGDGSAAVNVEGHLQSSTWKGGERTKPMRTTPCKACPLRNISYEIFLCLGQPQWPASSEGAVVGTLDRHATPIGH